MDDDPAVWAAETFDQLGDFVTVIDGAGDIVYTNPYAERTLGLEPGASIGRSMAEFLHPDDLVRALRVMAMMTSDAMDVPVTPAVYRLALAGGGWRPVEVNASVVSPPGRADAELVVILGRYSGDRDLQDRIMEQLIAGGSPTDVIELIPDFGRWRHPTDHYAVFFAGADGERRSAGSDLACALGELAEPGAPWHRAAATGEPVEATLDDFAPKLRAAAEAAGLVACWAVPVDDPLFGRSATIVAWGRAEASVMEVHRYALDTMARLLALILRWRQQVTSLRRAARLDPLTGLANRTGFWEDLEAIGSGPVGSRVGVLYIDLDGFKAVNDAHGHRVGDLVLKEVALRVNRVLRPSDVVARLGGDEFAVLCPDLVDDDVAVKIAERVVESLQRPFAVGGTDVDMGASVGIATAVAGTTRPDDLVDAADRALYLAKAAGRGRWHLG
jgi:diguanylate cyclase (GGDEF)-like protein/PAS domain S-box-containing protein